MTSISVRRAALADANAIGVIGPAAYLVTYQELWDHPDGLAMQLQTFGAEAVADFLSGPDRFCWVACYNEAVVGFVNAGPKLRHWPE